MQPSLVLAGEAGPERYEPLSRYEERNSSNSRTIILAPNITISANEALNPREQAEQIYAELSKIVRSDMKAANFFIPRLA